MDLKILLTNAPGLDLDRFDITFNKVKGYSLYPPISLATLAASVLRDVDGSVVEILDTELEIMKFYQENPDSDISPPDFLKKILGEKIESFKPDCIGISTMFSISHNNTINMAKTIKNFDPNIKVVNGGNHSTFAYKKLLVECKEIDFIFLYEADTSFPLYLKHLKGEKTNKDLKGVAWFNTEKNEVTLSPYSPIIHDLDALPNPNWDLVPLTKYQEYGRIGSINSFGDETKSSYVMQTVRGCVASCCFCSVRSFYGKGVRARSAKNILDEVDYLYNELGIQQLEIVDDDFSFDKERTLEFCNGLIERNYDMVWNLLNGIRLGTINDEIMEALAKSKCKLISIGVESGNDSTLAIVRKPLSIKMLRAKNEIIKRHPEVYVKGNFIVGFPFETDEQLLNTYNIAEEMKFDWNIFSVFKPLPGTPMFQEIDKEAQENFDFNSIKNDFQFEKIREVKITQKAAADLSMMHASADEIEIKQKELNYKGDQKISEQAYRKNLEINFMKNPNLNGRDIDRAIRDFTGILRFIDKDHAMARYCLNIAYKKKGDEKLIDENLKALDIILLDNGEWVKIFKEMLPTNEFEFFMDRLNYTNKTQIYHKTLSS